MLGDPLHRVGVPAALVLSLALLCSSTAESDCIGGDLSLWPPPGNSLPANGRLVIEAWGANMDIFADLLEEPAHMVANGDKVPLKIALHEGVERFAQAIATPERSLKPGLSYEFVSGGFERGRWKIEAKDTTAPVWKRAPVYKGLHHDGFSCDATTLAMVGVSVKTDSATIFHVELSQKGEPTRRFFVPLRGDLVPIGRPLCGEGPVDLKRAASYSAVLTAVDAAGHEATMPGPAVRFLGPTL